jgi:hypothetical protein
VKAAGAKYLPRLEAQTDEEYLAYQSRACFFNATRRAADAFVGLVFRKAPFVKIPGRSPQNEMACIQHTGPDGIRTVSGRYPDGILRV